MYVYIYIYIYIPYRKSIVWCFVVAENPGLQLPVRNNVLVLRGLFEVHSRCGILNIHYIEMNW